MRNRLPRPVPFYFLVISIRNAGGSCATSVVPSANPLSSNAPTKYSTMFVTIIAAIEKRRAAEIERTRSRRFCEGNDLHRRRILLKLFVHRYRTRARSTRHGNRVLISIATQSVVALIACFLSPETSFSKGYHAKSRGL